MLRVTAFSFSVYILHLSTPTNSSIWKRKLKHDLRFYVWTCDVSALRFLSIWAQYCSHNLFTRTITVYALSFDMCFINWPSITQLITLYDGTTQILYVNVLNIYDVERKITKNKKFRLNTLQNMHCISLDVFRLMKMAALFLGALPYNNENRKTRRKLYGELIYWLIGLFKKLDRNKFARLTVARIKKTNSIIWY